MNINIGRYQIYTQWTGEVKRWTLKQNPDSSMLKHIYDWEWHLVFISIVKYKLLK